MMRIWNEQRSVELITFVLYVCLFFYYTKCEAVEIKQMHVMFEGRCPVF